MKFSAVAILLGVVCGVVTSQTIGEVQCPNTPVKQGFDVNKYLGRWYEVQRTDFVIFLIDQKCIQATYTLKDNGRVRVENLAYNTASNETVGALGEAYAPDPKEPAKLAVDFGAGPAPYWVLDTDYDQYSIVYSCSNLTEDTYADIVWILGRTRTLPADLIQRLRDFIASRGIRTEPIVDSDQKNCD